MYFCLTNILITAYTVFIGFRWNSIIFNGNIPQCVTFTRYIKGVINMFDLK